MPEPISREKLDQVIERIAFEKMSVATACEGICAPSAFFRYLTEDAALEEQYTRARATRADARFESIDGVMGALLKGTIDHATARVMVDTIKWQCGREKPKRYGEKLDVKASVVIKSPKDMSAEELREWAQELGEQDETEGTRG